MIKKIIACLTICFIITGIISPVFSYASALPQPNWTDPGISEIINISDLTNWMLNGGTYDVSRYTDAESFMNDYFAARTKTRLEGSDYVIKSSFGLEQQYYEVGDSAYAHPLDVNRVIASSYRDHSGYGRRLSNEVNDSLLSTGSLYSTKIPLLNDVEFANFVGYNHNALRLYSEFFNNDNPSPTPIPNIPNDYSFISNINKLYLKYNGNYYEFFPNSNLGSYIYDNGYRTCELNTFGTLYCSSADFSTMHVAGGRKSSVTFQTLSPIITVYLTTLNDNTVNANWSTSQLSNVFNNESYNRTSVTVTDYLNNNILRFSPSNYNDVPLQPSTFSSLNIALNWIYDRYSNINIYVNNELWVLAGSAPSTPTITPEFPDAVGGEDLTSTTWPISRPRAPYYTNVPGVLQAIEDAIADDGKLDIDDLKPYLTDEYGDPVPDPIFDPEPVPIPVPDPVNPDVVPGLPILPAIPPEMPGYNGVSVLAEIINFTNQSLPTSLIVTFWGIVFGIVILGLIKILHK